MANRNEIENLQDLIKDSIGGDLVEQTVESLLPPGENYGSVIYKVDFKVKKDGKEEEYHAVAKCTPPNPVTQEIFNIQTIFKSEIAWYTTVIPTLKKFQRDLGVEKEIDFFQPFYGARTSLDPTSDKVDLDGVLLTQNLKPLGYHNIDRHIGFDLPTTYTILRDLAIFHAVPLAIKIQNPELFDKKIRPHVPSFNHLTTETVKEIKRKIYNVLEQIPECEPIMKKITTNIKKAAIFKMRPVRESWATVIHMDFWMNNIMVTGGEDSKTMILDLQCPSMGSPAADMVFFLLTSVKFDIIKEKFDHFVKFYYEEFFKNLKELNISTENYTFKEFLQEIETQVKLGELAHAFYHTIYIYMEKGTSSFDSSDTNFKQENFEFSINANEQHKEKFRWLIFEAIERKWI